MNSADVLEKAAPTFDYDECHARIETRKAAVLERRLRPALIRLWDGDYVLRGRVAKYYNASFQWVLNDTGIAEFDMPVDYHLSKWCADMRSRKATVNVTCDKDGARWSGFLDEMKIVKDNNGRKLVRLTFKHDLEHLHHLLFWANPFLLEQVQFPKWWTLWGRADWIIRATMAVNIGRIEMNAWPTFQNDIFKPSNWLPNLGEFLNPIGNWTQVVRPPRINSLGEALDLSATALLVSRFDTAYDATKDIMDDAELTWMPRRYLRPPPGTPAEEIDGVNYDPPPWEGAPPLRNGCLVWDLIDHSGRRTPTGTAIVGDLLGKGLEFIKSVLDPGGYTESDVTVDPSIPDEYFKPGWLGTLPAVPAVIYRESEHTGIQSSEFSWKPPTDVQMVSGGRSMPGVNAAIGAAIEAVGNLTTLIPVPIVGITVPPLGGPIEQLLRPVYSDVFAAFGKYRDNKRRTRLGAFHLWEKWVESPGAAYTFSFLMVMRQGLFETREITSHSLEIADGAPWRIGDNGRGHYFIGSRIGTAPMGLRPGHIHVDRVSEITLKADRDSGSRWNVVVGQREPDDPVASAWKRFQRVAKLAHDFAVV